MKINFLYGVLTTVMNNAPTIIAVIAVIISYKAIQISNKQSLFDKRIKTYPKTLTLLSSFETTRIKEHKYDESNYGIYKLEFYSLTGNSLLFEIMPVIDDIQEGLEHAFLIYCGSSNEKQENDAKVKQKQRFEIERTFYLELEKLKALSKEIQFLFKKESSVLLSQFVFEYQELLNQLYKYTSADEIERQKLFHESQQSKRLGETPKHKPPKVRKEMDEYNKLQPCIEKINETYNQIRTENVIKEIEKQIKF